jgi:hypothetical protein
MASITFTNTGGILAASFTASSSRKVKKDIIPSTVSALDLVNSINVVDFKYINDNEETPHVGFIAEDTNSLLSTPHLNGMDYTNCIGVLLKAVQEISKEIDDIKDKLG